MAFNWDQYQQMPTTGGVTGMPTIDPSQLSMVPSGINGMPVPLTDPSGPSVKFDPSQAAPSSPMQGGGGLAGTPGNSYPGMENDPQGINYSNYLRAKQGLPPLTAEQWGWPSTTATSGGSTSSGGGGKDAFGQAWLASGGRTVQDLKNFVAAHPEYGVKLGGSKGDKVYGPDGTYWADAVMSAGTGGTGALWDTNTGGGPGGSGPLSGSSMGNLGYSYGSSMAPWNEQFSAPTQEQALNTPGVQFGLEEANRMMQNSAAAKGTLLNGRFQQALAASNIGNAMQQYGDVYNRGLNEYLLKRQNFYNNEDRPFDKNLSLAQLGKPT